MAKGILLTLLVLLSGPVFAQDKAGSVVLSIGKNFAQLPQAEPRPLKRKSEIYTGDSISTGDKGQLQLRFTDGSRLSLRPDTEFLIEDYQFTEGAPEQGRSVYRLLKGGLRTITGAISKADNSHYQVNTPIATIGVRGTHYALFYCNRACEESTQTKMGLYGYVLEGEIVVATADEEAAVISRHSFYLNQDSGIIVTEKPLAVFETLKDLVPESALGEGIDNAIPALDVQSGPGAGSIQQPNNTPAPNIPAGRGPSY